MEKLMLYHQDGSYFSQRVRYAMRVKGVKYSQYSISMWPPENLQPWFLEINPDGEVPTITHGTQAISGSFEIMEYLDSAFPKTRQLFPSINTEDGKRVKHFSDLLTGTDKDIPLISFGSLSHPELTVGSSIKPALMKKLRNTRLSIINSKSIQSLITKYPQYEDTYKRKLEKFNWMRSSENLELLENSFKHIDEVLTQVEEELVLRSTEKQQLDDDEEMWLLGKSFTGVDILLGVLLHRITFIGLSYRFINEKKYPNLVNYYKQISQQDIFLKSCFPTKYSRGFLSSILFPCIRCYIQINGSKIALVTASLMALASAAIYYKYLHK